MKEVENWQKLMFSCRQACKLLGIEYQEPIYLDWAAGRSYYNTLWRNINFKKPAEIHNIHQQVESIT